MKQTKVLITGSNGQLAQCIENLQIRYSEIDFLFADSKKLDITKKGNIETFLKVNKVNYIINCAAYTNVEKAEKELKKAFQINATGVKNLAETCKDQGITLIHISTDYVFDGEKDTPYNEEDVSNPLNEYGKSKLKGEQYIQQLLKEYFIIRTSWLYSQFGKNFYKTILKKSETEERLTITTSETGTPTNANDLASFLLQIIKTSSKKYGVYHFSNLGSATWYDFAEEILRILGKLDKINLEKTDNYPTFAQRPKYSVLDKSKVKTAFMINILDWKISLQKLSKNKIS